MQQFRTSPESLAIAFARRQRKALQYAAGLAVASSLVVIGWAIALERYQVLLLMPLMTGVLAMIYRRNNRVQQTRLAEMRYAVDSNSITLIGDGHPLRIDKDEITSIEENRYGALVVKTGHMFRFLYIRPDVERKDELWEILRSWKPIGPRSDRWIEVWPRASVWMALSLAPLTVTVCVSQNPAVVVPVGLILLGIMTLSIVTIYHQKGTVTHKAAALACSLPCIGLVGKIINVMQ